MGFSFLSPVQWLHGQPLCMPPYGSPSHSDWERLSPSSCRPFDLWAYLQNAILMVHMMFWVLQLWTWWWVWPLDLFLISHFPFLGRPQPSAWVTQRSTESSSWTKGLSKSRGQAAIHCSGRWIPQGLSEGQSHPIVLSRVLWPPTSLCAFVLRHWTICSCQRSLYRGWATPQHIPGCVPTAGILSPMTLLQNSHQGIRAGLLLWTQRALLYCKQHATPKFPPQDKLQTR